MTEKGRFAPSPSGRMHLGNVLSFLPGTYGTALIRNHALNGALNKLSELGLADEYKMQMCDAIDCNLYFFNDKVSTPAMYVILAGSCAVLIAVYVIMSFMRRNKSAG